MLKFFSWKWILGLILEWAAENLTQEIIDEWVDDLKKIAIPWCRDKVEELLTGLEAKAAATDNQLDDVVVAAVRKVLYALLPDNPGVL